ncbi:MAG: TIGR04141 family sporadically distributed protein [Bacteroidetes bacterium]|nr:TIGR04141 family sporadically distributed protein [Bacteroidota bacterium]
MADKEKRSNIAIWKIDKNIDQFIGKNINEIIDSIVEVFNKKRKLYPVKIAVDSYDGKNMKIFYSIRKSPGWSMFLSCLIKDDLSEGEKDDIFSTMNKDVILFIYDDKDIFSITGGSGYNIIQSYIDERFPFDIAKRLLNGEFKSSEVRDLTGSIYSQSKNFRRNYNFSKREAFGKVWKKLTGKIDSKILRDSLYINFSSGKNQKKDFNADIKSSFTFRKSITFDEVVSIVKEIQALLNKETTPEQDKIFGFLDTLKEVKSKEQKEILRDVLIKKIFDFIKSSNSECDSLDFCHPKEIVAFLCGSNYMINEQMKWDDSPSATEVLLKIRDNFKEDNFDDFKNKFYHLYLQFQDNDDSENIIDNLWKYFHGEVEKGNKKYFFIDGKWYEIVGDFLNRLRDDFCDEVFGQKSILISDIPYVDWGLNEDEGSFNKNHIGKSNFIFGDKIFYKQTDKGKIELFDLIYITDDKIYIIQAKEGFSASVRDACSQIQMSIEIIENIIDSDDQSILSGYFSELNEKNNNTLNYNDFINNLKNKERVYVLAFSDKKDFTEENFRKDKFPSEIARFEILGLLHESRGNNVSFNICHIKKK